MTQLPPPPRAEFSYLGIDENGEARVIMMDDQNDRKWTAREVANLIRDGYGVIRLPHKEACDRFKADLEKTKVRRAKAEAAE